MNQDLPPELQSEHVIVSGKQFSDWTSLNDTIMGGSSTAICSVTTDGLKLNGDLVEKGGGFVSCRSPLLSPPINLSEYRGLKLIVDGQGRTLKLAIACQDNFFGLTDFISGGLRWVAEVPTQIEGTTQLEILFSNLQPTIRAKRVTFPATFDPSTISQFQLLHSKFGRSGELNPGFKPGMIRILLRSIIAIP